MYKFNKFLRVSLISFFAIFLISKVDAATLSAMGSIGVLEKEIIWNSNYVNLYPGITCYGESNVTMTVQFRTNTRTTKCDGTMVAAAARLGPNNYTGKLTFSNPDTSIRSVLIKWGMHGSPFAWESEERLNIPAATSCSLEYTPSVSFEGVVNEYSRRSIQIVSASKGNGSVTFRPSNIDGAVPYIVNTIYPSRRWFYSIEPSSLKQNLTYDLGTLISILPGIPRFSGSYSGSLTLTLSCN